MKSYESRGLQNPGKTASNGLQSLSQRDVRALTEYLTILEDAGRVGGADDLFLVVSESGSEYLVDRRSGTFECPDATHRDPDGGCKHLRRVTFATSERAIPAGVDPDALDDQLGGHISRGPQMVATDGGIIEDVILTEAVPEITEHYGSFENGGAKYWQCGGCGAETIYDPECIPHQKRCPQREVDDAW